MKITYYSYNTFLIESGDKKIAIDPGALFFYYFKFTTLIPKSEWADITHILVTHGDPDHHWHTDRVAKASNAAVICNKTMLREVNGRTLMLGPRSKGLAFTAEVNNVHTLSVNETMEMDGMSITGLKAVHGPLLIKMGPISKRVYPGPGERIGWGSMGFSIQIDGKTIVNLGDSQLLSKEWSTIENPDVLMLPIGGKVAGNTMDEEDALAAVKAMQPKLVIPCHYNERALFNDKYCPADDKTFKSDVENSGIPCEIMQTGQSITI